ncbi:hypothetical protein CANMA_000378, partial [Candida margitis]|uniref:uncharacterized protein n=1 Tax=Candida margitis TaxID=1775924 RepID=UPI00222774EE
MSNLENESKGDSINKLENQQTNSSSSGPSIHEFSGFDAHRVQKIARTYTNEDSNSATKLRKYLTHMSQVPGVSPLEEEEGDERLDPNSDSFDSKFWVKNQKKLFEKHPDYYKPSKLGVAYRDLRAYGTA